MSELGACELVVVIVFALFWSALMFAIGFTAGEGDQ